METYMMMLYVSLEQEQALKQFFLDNDWEYCKPDLSALTDCVGPLVAQIPHTKKPQATRKKQLYTSKKINTTKTSNFSQTPEPNTLTSEGAATVTDSEEHLNTPPQSRAKKRKLVSSEAKLSRSPAGLGIEEDIVAINAGGATVNLDGTVTGDDEAGTQTADASTVMDLSCEENRSNDDSDWERSNTAKSKGKQSAKKKRDVKTKSKATAGKKKPATKREVKIVVKKEKDAEDENLSVFSSPIVIKKETLACDDCDKTFTIQRHLKNHCKKVHGVDIDMEFKSPDEQERVYECDRCDSSYSRVYGLKQHQRTKHGINFEATDKPFTCNICFLKYDTSLFLELHQADKHGNVVNGQDVEHECKTCGETFQKYRAFRLHVKQHDLKSKKHICEVCGRVFGRADSLLSHRKFIHMGMKRNRDKKSLEKKFQCEICGSGFFRRSNLNEHFSVKHSDEPLNHKCEHCDKTFNRPSIMEYHVNKVHLKQKPYSCDKCDKKCFSKHSLHEHKMLCSMKEERKKRCEQCGKLFTTGHNYKLHMQAMHSTPALICPCGTVVRWQSSVTKHKRRCSLYNTKLAKNKKDPVALEFVEQVMDIENRQAAASEDQAVVYLQNQMGETGVEYTEMEDAVEETGTTVVVSETEAEVAESVSRLLEGIPSTGLAGEGGERQDVTVVEEQVVEGGERVSYSNVSVVGDGQDSQKVYYVIQY